MNASMFGICRGLTCGTDHNKSGPPPHPVGTEGQTGWVVEGVWVQREFRTWVQQKRLYFERSLSFGSRMK
jgi:hypothetical protein